MLYSNLFPKSWLRFSLRAIVLVTTGLGVVVYANAPRLRALWSNWVDPGLELAGSDLPGQWASYQEMHAHYTQSFVESEGFGISRIADFDEPQFRNLEIAGQPYRVRELRLIGLMGERPKVYESSWIALQRDQLERYPVRDLTEFENTALQRLQVGGELVWQDHAKLEASSEKEGPSEGYTLVGALRASNSCQQCHEAQDQELLGAFVYSLQRVHSPQGMMGLTDPIPSFPQPNALRPR